MRTSAPPVNYPASPSPASGGGPSAPDARVGTRSAKTRPSDRRHRRAVFGLFGKDERLDGDVRIDVIVAEERIDLPAGDLLDSGDELMAHGRLKRPAHVEDELGSAVGDK